jgi:hypothetical protein
MLNVLLRRYIENQILQTAARPGGVSFVSCCFSITDVAAWMSNAAACSPLPDLPLQAYIQSNGAAIYREIVPDSAHKHFCVVKDVYEYCIVGSHSVDRGRQATKNKALSPIKIC